jgi:rare lipoprotein A
MKKVNIAAGAAMLATAMIFAMPGAVAQQSATVVEEAVGHASWYGAKFHGEPTASGEPFDMTELTAAHRTLPFGTRVRVTHLSNGRSVVVRINDRGPYIRGRIIDLSRAAAGVIGMTGQGIARIRMDIIGR